MCCFCSGPFSFGRIKWFMTSCSVNCFQRFIYLLLAPLSSRLSVESVRWDRESGTVCSGTGPEAIKVQSNNTLKKSRSTSKRDREREQKGRHKINLLTAILAETNRKQQKKKTKKNYQRPVKWTTTITPFPPFSGVSLTICRAGVWRQISNRLNT